eukprot:gnl/TRDRNA2_/TRDRNA2_43185_c0_seq1.p1 gnl/TRDRNA2_/TRDRNA2_43185_c0~~gnl/TRDRNA2_/TRDRNA2_43185_c0_seq1.p1  ORF type:complete len:142 (-),score=22.21 gnl/TRDRNA2_/TRDRNA2_43185_c0_seq1:78-503(-)
MGASPCKCNDPDGTNEYVVVDPVSQESVIPAQSPKSVGVMTLGFEIAEGQSKSVAFTQRPMGLDFAMRAPIIISDVTKGSIADELGVQRGWKLTSVNGKDLAKTDFQNQYDLLSKLTKQLPDVRVMKKGEETPMPEAAMGA